MPALEFWDTTMAFYVAQLLLRNPALEIAILGGPLVNHHVRQALFSAKWQSHKS